MLWITHNGQRASYLLLNRNRAEAWSRKHIVHNHLEGTRTDGRGKRSNTDGPGPAGKPTWRDNTTLARLLVLIKAIRLDYDRVRVEEGDKIL